MEDLFKNIIELDFGKANKAIIEFTRSKKNISDDELLTILSWKDKELINTFFENFNFFSLDQLSLLEDYINKNLSFEDNDFVSDLIELACDWSLNIDYLKVLSFLTLNEESSHFVVLSSVRYIIENVKLLHIQEIYSKLEYILNNASFAQNVQISAALGLFRLTNKIKYLYEIKDWFGDSEENRIFLDNILKREYFKDEFFVNVKKILEY